MIILKKYLYNYIKEIDEKIKSKKIDDLDISNHLIKISFFQHERLIHLLVTLFYVLFVIAFGIFTCFFMPFAIIEIILIIFLAFYVVHYFRLENGVQYLYHQYDKMNKILKK